MFFVVSFIVGAIIFHFAPGLLDGFDVAEVTWRTSLGFSLVFNITLCAIGSLVTLIIHMIRRSVAPAKKQLSKSSGRLLSAISYGISSLIALLVAEKLCTFQISDWQTRIILAISLTTSSVACFICEFIKFRKEEKATLNNPVCSIRKDVI